MDQESCFVNTRGVVPSKESFVEFVGYLCVNVFHLPSGFRRQTQHYLHFSVEEMRQGEINHVLSVRDVARKWRSWDLNPGRLNLAPVCIATTLHLAEGTQLFIHKKNKQMTFGLLHAFFSWLDPRCLVTKRS